MWLYFTRCKASDLWYDYETVFFPWTIHTRRETAGGDILVSPHSVFPLQHTSLCLQQLQSDGILAKYIYCQLMMEEDLIFLLRYGICHEEKSDGAGTCPYSVRMRSTPSRPAQPPVSQRCFLRATSFHEFLCKINKIYLPSFKICLKKSCKDGCIFWPLVSFFKVKMVPV